MLKGYFLGETEPFLAVAPEQLLGVTAHQLTSHRRHVCLLARIQAFERSEHLALIKNVRQIFIARHEVVVVYARFHILHKSTRADVSLRVREYLHASAHLHYIAYR